MRKRKKKDQVPVRRWRKEDLTSRTRQAAEKATGNLVLVAETPGLSGLGVPAPPGSWTGSGGPEEGSPLGRAPDPGALPARANQGQPKLGHERPDSSRLPVARPLWTVVRFRGCAGARGPKGAKKSGQSPVEHASTGCGDRSRGDFLCPPGMGGWGVAATVFRQLGLNPSPAPRPALSNPQPWATGPEWRPPPSMTLHDSQVIGSASRERGLSGLGLAPNFKWRGSTVCTP